MNKKEALNLLSYHSLRSNDVENSKWTKGFLGNLLQFEGVLYEENFIDIMDCLKVLSDDCSKEKLDQGLVSDLIALLHLGRRWIEKRRTLEPVCLLSEEQAEQIRKWLSIIESTVFNLLQGNIYEAFWEYDKYMEEVNSNDKTGSLRYGRYTFKSV